jgi:hypothetical protein
VEYREPHERPERPVCVPVEIETFAFITAFKRAVCLANRLWISGKKPEQDSKTDRELRMNMWVRVGMSMWVRVGMWYWHTRRTEESATVAPRNWTRTENGRDTTALSAADDLLRDTKPSRAPSINAKILPRPR